MSVLGAGDPGLRPRLGDRAFDSDLVPPHHRSEVSREFLAASYRLEPLTGGKLSARATMVDMGSVRLTHGFLSDATLSRKADEDVAQAEEQVSLFLTTGGRWRGEAGRNVKDVGPGQLVFLDRSQGLSGSIESLSSITFVVPKRVLLAQSPGLEDLHGRTLAGPMARLLADQLASAARHAVLLDAQERLTLGRSTTALVVGALANGAGETSELVRPAVADALLGRAKRLIQAHCGDPRLTPEKVAAVLGLSRAGLYRVFEAEGGVARCIRQARIDAACAALQDVGDLRRIGEIGLACGFTSEAQFSRAMRDAFGAPPSELRQHGFTRRPADQANDSRWPAPVPNTRKVLRRGC